MTADVRLEEGGVVFTDRADGSDRPVTLNLRAIFSCQNTYQTIRSRRNDTSPGFSGACEDSWCFAIPCEQNTKVAGTGFEGTRKSLRKQRNASTRDAQCGALVDPASIPDARLAEIVATWPQMPEPIRVAVLSLIRAAGCS
jgi:hypothetical protein